jgi:hypothetical protein
MRHRAIAAALVGALHSTAAHSENRFKVPNGEANSISTGHAGGDGAFRWSFSDAGHVWTKQLCEMDTDGDGQSNGLELGDPCCLWSIGADEAALIGFTQRGRPLSEDPAGISIAGLSSSMTSRTMPDCTRTTDFSPPPLAPLPASPPMTDASPPPSTPAIDAPACPEGCVAVGTSSRARLLLFSAMPSCPTGCKPVG